MNPGRSSARSMRKSRTCIQTGVLGANDAKAPWSPPWHARVCVKVTKKSTATLFVEAAKRLVGQWRPSICHRHEVWRSKRPRRLIVRCSPETIAGRGIPIHLGDRHEHTRGVKNAAGTQSIATLGSSSGRSHLSRASQTHFASARPPTLRPWEVFFILEELNPETRSRYVTAGAEATRIVPPTPLRDFGHRRS